MGYLWWILLKLCFHSDQQALVAQNSKKTMYTIMRLRGDFRLVVCNKDGAGSHVHRFLECNKAFKID